MQNENRKIDLQDDGASRSGVGDMPAVRGGASARWMRLGTLPKILLFWGAVGICLVGYLFLLSLLRGWVFGGAVSALFLAAMCFVLNGWFLRAEGRSVASIGFDKPGLRMKLVGIGFAGGAVLLLGWNLIVTILTSAYWRWQPGFNGAAVPGLVIFYLFNNAAEELAYRGYAFLRLEETYGRTVAIVGTSVVFALMHMQGGMGWLNAALGVLTTAMVFGVMMSRWRSLPLVIGFHWATNVMQDVLGLRQTPLSLVQLEGGREVGSGRGLIILLAVAFLNLAVFGVLGGFRKRGRMKVENEQ